MTARETHIKLMKGRRRVYSNQGKQQDAIAALFIYKPVLCACGKTFNQKCYKDEEPTQTKCPLCLCL